MTHVLVRHKVKDYTTWKKEFDDFVEFRKSSGEKSFQILQPDEDANNLYLLFAWDNEENAHRFMESSKLKERMEKAGVIEAPEIRFLSESDRGSL